MCQFLCQMQLTDLFLVLIHVGSLNVESVPPLTNYQKNKKPNDVNLVLSVVRSATNYGPRSFSLDHSECLLHFDYLTHNATYPLILSFCSLCLSTLLLQLLTWGWTLKRANTPGKLSYQCVFTDKAGSERWRQVLYRCRWTLRLSVVLSVSLAEVQNLAGSKPNRKSTSCMADLTVHLSSADCSVDRFVKKVDFLTCFCASDVPW